MIVLGFKEVNFFDPFCGGIGVVFHLHSSFVYDRCSPFVFHVGGFGVDYSITEFTFGSYIVYGRFVVEMEYSVGVLICCLFFVREGCMCSWVLLLIEGGDVVHVLKYILYIMLVNKSGSFLCVRVLCCCVSSSWGCSGVGSIVGRSGRA